MRLTPTKGYYLYRDKTSFRIAKGEGVRENYAARIFAGALLAPDIIQCVLSGRQPVTFTVESLRTPPPLDWTEQRRTFGFHRA